VLVHMRGSLAGCEDLGEGASESRLRVGDLDMSRDGRRQPARGALPDGVGSSWSAGAAAVVCEESAYEAVER
jgi:hypothetical protein